MRKIKNFGYGFLLSVLALGLMSCGQDKGSEASTAANSGGSEVFKIGGIGPTTGPAATYGKAVENAMKLAVDEINKSGGMNGYNVELSFKDDEHDAEKSVNAYNSLKDWGMQVLVGTVTSTPCIAVADKTNEDGIFQITPSGSAVECTTHPNVFRVCFSDPDQGSAAATYISQNKLAKKIAVIYDSSDVYSSGVFEKFSEEAAKVGLDIVAKEAFTSDNNTDFTTQLQKAKDADADLVFLPIYYTEASLILKQADTMGYKPKFFGCDGLDGILTVENYDKKLAESVMLLTPFAADSKDELTQKFVKEFKEKYGNVPSQFAADAYDGVYAVKLAIEKAKVTPSMSVSEISEKLTKAMTEIKLNGLTGNDMSWTEDGEPHKEPKAVIIKNGEYVAM